MSRRSAIILASVLALILLLTVFVVKLADGTFRNEPAPQITAPSVELKQPEPKITAAADVKLAPEAKPEVTTEAAPLQVTSIPFDPPVSTYQATPVVPFYQAPITQPQVPLTGSKPPLSQPIIPSPVQPLPSEVTKPVEGVLEPLTPVTDPLLGTVKDILPPLPKTIEVGIEPHEPDIETLLPH